MSNGTRNINGKGTIYKDETRNLWIYQVSYIDPDTGLSKRKKFSGKLKKVATAKGEDFLNNLNSGLLPKSTQITTGEWITQWLNDYCKQRVRPRTWEKYKSCLDCYVMPKYQDVLLKDLTSSDIQKHFNNLLANGRIDGKGLSSLTVRNTRRYLTMCLDRAIKDGLLVKNVVKDTEPPKFNKKDIIVLSTDQIDALMEQTKFISNKYMLKVVPTVILLTLHTGLRLGEVLGLKWEDIILKDACIYIKRSLAYVIGQGHILQEPKSKSSKRKILILPDDIDMLKEYKIWQEQHTGLLRNKYVDNGLVFANTFGNPLDIGNLVSRYFKPLLKPAGINENFTFHGLRHTHATLLLQQGVNPKVIQERLGHSNIGMTLDIYSHVLPDMQSEAVNALATIFNKKDDGKNQY
jgi:integrase